MRGRDANLDHPDLDDWIARVATSGPWLVWNKSQLAGFSLIAGILEP
jgi:hypothetical protein